MTVTPSSLSSCLTKVTFSSGISIVAVVRPLIYMQKYKTNWPMDMDFYNQFLFGVPAVTTTYIVYTSGSQSFAKKNIHFITADIVVSCRTL
jgi:hypothetical protein